MTYEYHNCDESNFISEKNIPNKLFQAFPKAWELSLESASLRDTSSPYYKNLWDTLEVIPAHLKESDGVAARIHSRKFRYISVEQVTGVPWFVIGVLHQMESGGDWSKCLHNGQPWNKVTTIPPVGRGPFNSWETSAIDALDLMKKSFPPIWSIEYICSFFEKYNGLGYAHHQVNSPYLYSFSNHGVGVGKYVGEKPGVPAHYDPKAVSDQVGAVVMLKRLVSMSFCPTFFNPSIFYDPDVAKEDVKKYQAFLNANFGCTLLPDGKAGNKTSEAHKKIFGQYLLGDKRPA